MMIEIRIPIKLLSYIKQDLKTKLETQRRGLESQRVSETK